MSEILYSKISTWQSWITQVDNECLSTFSKPKANFLKWGTLYNYKKQLHFTKTPTINVLRIDRTFWLDFKLILQWNLPMQTWWIVGTTPNWAKVGWISRNIFSYMKNLRSVTSKLAHTFKNQTAKVPTTGLPMLKFTPITAITHAESVYIRYDKNHLCSSGYFFQ